MPADLDTFLAESQDAIDEWERRPDVAVWAADGSHEPERIGGGYFMQDRASDALDSFHSTRGNYDREGRRISFRQWAELHCCDPDYHRVARDTVEGVWVSTVWLGLDHNFGMAGTPLIFETMLFPAPADPAMPPDHLGVPDWTDLMERYSTEEQALAGHARAVDFVRTAMGCQDAP